MQREFFNMHPDHHHQQQMTQEQILYAQPSTAASFQNPNPFVNMSLVQPHFMPEPTTEPWNLDSMPWKTTTNNTIPDNGIMKFHAGSIDSLEEQAMQRRMQLHQKRKSDILPDHVPKQFISEEKFTAHFNGLHISSDYVQQRNPNSIDGENIDDMPSTSGICFTNRTYEDYRVTAKELEEKLLKANRITICDEVKKMYEEQKKMSFLPETLMTPYEAPCKALVLWQPTPLDIIKGSSALTEMIERNQNKKKKDTSNDNEQMSDTTNGTNSNRGLQNALEDFEDFTNDQRDVEIDDFIDNNNTSSYDFNSSRQDVMDEDL